MNPRTEPAGNTPGRGGLGALYQEVIIDHGRRPRNFRIIPNATRTIEGYNPLCGDQLTLYVKLADHVKLADTEHGGAEQGDSRILDIAFQGSGCAISQASASLMTTALNGATRAEALLLFTRVHAMLAQGPGADARLADVGKLAVLSGVWEFPARVKCATLAWNALRSALAADGSPISAAPISTE